MNRLVSRCLAGLLVLLAVSPQASAQSFINLPSIGGAVMLPDGNTLVVSIPTEAKLAYFDTTTGKELKRVEVEFQPNCLAVQGKKLFASVKGSAIIHMLDADSGKAEKQIRLPGEPVQAMACHPTKGLLYATNLGDEVLAVDFEKMRSGKGGARGQLIAVDQVDGNHVYTGVQKPIREVLVFEGNGEKFKVGLAQANLSAVILKYAVTDKGPLKLVGANDNAAVNGRGMGLSADGKKIAMAGGGGWRSKADPKANYSVAVFDTMDTKGMLGMIECGPYPANVAFHPVLPLAVAFRSNSKEIHVVSSKSFVKKELFKTKGDSHSSVITWGGNGTVLIFAAVGQGGLGGPAGTTLEFFPLKLSAEEQELLKKGQK